MKHDFLTGLRTLVRHRPSPLRLFALAPLLPLLFSSAHSQLAVQIREIDTLNITSHTGMKPQSKLWQQDGIWWGCFADSTGTHIWQLDGDHWTRSFELTSDTLVRADVKAHDWGITVLLFSGVQSSVIQCAYFKESKRYDLLDQTIVTLDEGVETATIDSDGDGLLWIASDSENQVNVRWKGPSDRAFSEPITLVDGISKDDICVITSLGHGRVGVLWSNQNTQRYGFRRHVAATEPESWFPDEVPAEISAIRHGDGMSDDHLNIAVSSDGTLYATVKTSYDTEGMPLVACLIRRPHGKWDPLYHVDDEGSRGIMLLDESRKTFYVVYTSYRDNSIVFKSSSTDSIAFSERVTLMEGRRINNVSSTRQNVSGTFPIVASQGDSLMHTVIVEVE